MRLSSVLVVVALSVPVPLSAQTLSVDTSAAGRQQVIDGFGTALEPAAQQSWFQSLYLDDLQASMVRFDMTPRFVSPYSDSFYYSPWFGSAIRLPGPDRNNVRTYTGPQDYSRDYGGFRAPIPVMGPDIDQNVRLLDVSSGQPLLAGLIGQAARQRPGLAAFQIVGTIFSPAPWLKVASGNVSPANTGVLPAPGTPYPFIWNANYGAGTLDISDVPLEVFNDGTGPTSALTQFARTTAAYLRAFQQRYGVSIQAVSIQNELGFEQYFNSCKYPLTTYLAAALKALRAELDRYPDLAPTQLIGPEDLLLDGAFSFWQFGGGPTLQHKNLRFLAELQSDPVAWQALSIVAVHANVSELSWQRWAHGWTTSPQNGLPAAISGFTAYGRKSWMTETSGHANTWPAPPAAPTTGALGLAIAIHRALTVGQESAWMHWQFANDQPAGGFTLTDAQQGNQAPKYIAAKHFFRYIRPHAQRVNVTVADAPTLQASGYIHDADHTLTLVLINTGDAAVTTTLMVPPAPENIWSLDVVTSDATHPWISSTVPVSTDGSAIVTIPAYGIVTVQGAATDRLRIPAGVYQLMNQYSGLVIETPRLFFDPGRLLIQFFAHAGINQRFAVEAVGNGGYRLRNQFNGRVLGVSDAGAGATALLEPESASPFQLWSVGRAEPGADSLVLTNQGSGMILDVGWPARLPGARIVQQPATGAISQRWQLVRLP